MQTITFHGSHGAFTVCAVSGYMIEAAHCDCEDCERTGGYQEIAFVDLAHTDPLALQRGVGDILGASLVYRDGSYEPACAKVEDEDGFHYYEPLMALPAPDGSERTVCVNAWRFEDGDQTYSDAAAGEHVDGWSVYLRVDQADRSEPFDIPEDYERDFTGPDAEQEAFAYAEELAARFGCEVRDY